MGEDGQVRTQLIATDAVRWLDERIELPESATEDDLASLLSDRMQGLVESSPQRNLLVTWRIATGGPPAVLLRRGGLATELAARMRTEFGRGKAAAWTVSVAVETPAEAPTACYEEETILGHFLRAVRDLQEDDDTVIDLQPYLSARHEAGTISSAVQLVDKTSRAAVLSDAAMLGIDLLRGDDLSRADREPAPSSSGSQETTR